MELRNEVKNALPNDEERLIVHLTDVEGIIVDALYRMRASTPEIEKYGTSVEIVIDAVRRYGNASKQQASKNGQIDHVFVQDLTRKAMNAIKEGRLKGIFDPTALDENVPKRTDCTEATEDAIKVIPCISFYQIAGAIAKNCYRMHPFHNPESVYQIIRDTLTELREFRFMKKPPFTYAMIGKDFEYLQSVRPADLFKELNRILMSLPDFRKLNLSLAEKQSGITDPEDPARSGGICFASRYGGPAKENDFIDLDACIQNIYLTILEDCLDEEVATLRNKRFNAFPWLTPNKSEKADSHPDRAQVITFTRVPEEAVKPDMKECLEQKQMPHKGIIEIETICGAIRGYFGGNARKICWGHLSNAEMNKMVDQICAKLEELLLFKQEEWYKNESTDHMHFIGFDTLQDLIDLIRNLTEISEFNKLTGEAKVGMAESHINEIADIAILMRYPGVSLRYLVDHGNVLVEERNNTKEDQEEK